MPLTVLLLLAGLVVLIIGGELLVRGAVKAAQSFNVSPLLIGLTLVGFGTSTPELVTSIEAARAGSPGIAVGNVVGSNIANILLILSVAALIKPIAVESGPLKRDGGLVVLTALAMLAIGVVGLDLDLWVGITFVAALVGYIFFAYLQERGQPELGHGAAYGKAEAYGELHDAPLRPEGMPMTPSAGGSTAGTASQAGAATSGGLALALATAIGGLFLVVLGGKLLVDNAIALASSLGISQTIIGLTIVAVGTSLPEMVTSVLAALRGHSAVAIGNVMGSCIYNVLGIAGLTALISPTSIPPEIASFDNFVMVAASFAMLVFAATGLRVGRREGGLLLAGYAAYVWAIWPK